MNSKQSVHRNLRRFTSDHTVPAATRYELVHPSANGGRHAQAVKIAVSLISNGITPSAVFAQLRSMYGADVPDKEIADIVRWASRKTFEPCGFRIGGVVSAVSPPVPPIEMIKRFLGNTSVAGMCFEDMEAELWEASPWRPLEDWRLDSLIFLAGCYHANEKINIVTEYSVEKANDGKEKARPQGKGRTMSRDAWMKSIRDHGTPQSKAGAWIRMNPTDGGICDGNIVDFRFALNEADHVPLELQLALLVKLPLPINAIVYSGGRSMQGLVRVNAKSGEAYCRKVCEMLGLLKNYGIDPSNKNPSRLARLPGAQRVMGASGNGQQRLLYFAPDRIDSKPIL